MAKNKEWLKEEVSKLRPTGNARFDPDYLEIERFETLKAVLKIVDKLDEPKKVVVPRFVADFLANRKIDFKSAHNVVTYIKSYGWDDETSNEFLIYKWMPENLLTFCIAWADGYTIEEES